MTKQSKQQNKKQKKEPDYVGFFAPAGIFIGMGIGFLIGNFLGGLFLGLGIGFLLMACFKVDWDKLSVDSNKKKRK